MPFNVEFKDPVTEFDKWDDIQNSPEIDDSFEGPMDTFAAG